MRDAVQRILFLWVLAIPVALAYSDDRSETAYPLERLQLDWMRQDASRLDVAGCFARRGSCELERQMVRKVIDDIKSRGAEASTTQAYEKELASLARSLPAGDDPVWKQLYFQLWLKIEFGRLVETERVTLCLRKLPGQQKTWTSATLEFSNTRKVPVRLTNIDAAQEFVFPKELTAWVKLSELYEDFPLSDNGVVEMQVHGKDVE